MTIRGLAGFIELGLRTYAEGCESSPVPSLGHREMASDVELENDRSLRMHRALGYEDVERLVCFRRDLT